MSECFLMGHADAGEAILPLLIQMVERLTNAPYCVTRFTVGHYGNFDRLAARAVMEVKRKNKQIQLFLLVPYHPEKHPVEIPSGFDGTEYPEGMECVPPRYAIVRANRCMINRVEHLIVYVRHTGSNTQKLLDYAGRVERKRGLHIWRVSLPEVK